MEFQTMEIERSSLNKGLESLELQCSAIENQLLASKEQFIKQQIKEKEVMESFQLKENNMIQLMKQNEGTQRDLQILINNLQQEKLELQQFFEKEKENSLQQLEILKKEEELTNSKYQQQLIMYKEELSLLKNKNNEGEETIKILKEELELLNNKAREKEEDETREAQENLNFDEELKSKFLESQKILMNKLSESQTLELETRRALAIER
jgi:hypothetical protein